MQKQSFFCAIALAALSVLVLSGCCHVQLYTEEAPAASAGNGYQVCASGTVRNSGYYLFNKYPLYTGHPDHPNRKDYHTFCDDITPEVNSAILLNAMRKQYKAETLTDVEHVETAWGYFSLWLVWRKSITTSAVGLKKAKNTRK